MQSAVQMHFAHVTVDGAAVPFKKSVQCRSVLQWKSRVAPKLSSSIKSNVANRTVRWCDKKYQGYQAGQKSSVVKILYFSKHCFRLSYTAISLSHSNVQAKTLPITLTQIVYR